MAWIESHQDLANHPKAKRFRRKMKISEHEAVGLLHYFWWWALDFAQDGDITGFSPDDVADGCRYEGDSTTFIDALVESGFVDNAEGRLMLHEWMEYGGKLIAWRKSNAEKQKEYRERTRNKPINNGNVTVTLPSRDYDEEGYVPEVTVTVTDTVKKEKNTTTGPEILIQDEYAKLHGKFPEHVRAKEVMAIKSLVEHGIPTDFILSSMKQIQLDKQGSGEVITSFAYYPEPIKRMWKEHTMPKVVYSASKKGNEIDWDAIERRLLEREAQRGNDTA